MAATQEELQAAVCDLTTDAFECFGEDIGTMFDTDVIAEEIDFGEGTAKDLKEDYKKLVAVCSVNSEGSLNGEFHIVFDKDGLFTLAGTFVMQPEKVISQNRKNGTEEEAQEIGDAIGEVGNLLVGSWDKVFRENFEGHGHFVQSGTFIGNPWNKPEENIRIGKEDQLVLRKYQITVSPLDPFYCTAIYPASIFDPNSAPEPEPADDSAEAQAQEEQPSTEEQTAEQPVEETAEQEQEQSQEQHEQPVEQQDGGEQSDSAQTGSAEAQAGDDQQDNEQSEQAPKEAGDEQLEQQIAETSQPQAQPAQSNTPVSDAIKTMTTTTADVPGDLAPDFLRCLTAADIMRTDLTWASEDETVEQLVAKMQRNNSGYILVGSEGNLEGIVSKSDVRGAMSPYLQSMFVKWRGPMDIATLQIKAKWVMSRPVRTVRPDASIAAIMRSMSQHGGRCMPVVDGEGVVRGTVSVFDIFRAMQGSQAGQTTGHTPQAPPLA